MKAEPEKYWTAFYTKPRNEKKAAERLATKGFQVFCPVRTILKQWSDRKKKVQEVLFTSYIFAFVSEKQRQEMLHDQGLVSSVFWLKQPVRIPKKEIDAIKHFLSDHPNAEAIAGLNIGQQIDIKAGPLKGEQGIIQKIKGTRVTLSLDVLGVTLQAEIPSSQLV